MQLLVIAIFVILGILIIASMFIAFTYYKRVQQCETTQSPYCFALLCPVTPNVSSGICKGFAHRYDNDGNLICAV